MAQEPPPLSPFGPRPQPTTRDDARPGTIELSDGTVRTGAIRLTRDFRLAIYDEQQERNREIPLSAVARIDCAVVKEWMEAEWRFQENASDRKVYTGRSYPAREYVHTITLRDGRTIRGPMAALIYLQPDGVARPERHLLHKRDKGPPGSTLDRLVYVRAITFEVPD